MSVILERENIFTGSQASDCLYHVATPHAQLPHDAFLRLIVTFPVPCGQRFSRKGKGQILINFFWIHIMVKAELALFLGKHKLKHRRNPSSIAMHLHLQRCTSGLCRDIGFLSSVAGTQEKL